MLGFTVIMMMMVMMLLLAHLRTDKATGYQV